MVDIYKNMTINHNCIFRHENIFVTDGPSVYLYISTTQQDVWPSDFDAFGSKMIGYRLDSQGVVTHHFQTIPLSYPDSFQLSTDSNNPHSKVFGFS